MESSDVKGNEFDYDEIKQYLHTRYLCPHEAAYRLLEYPLYDFLHTINRLAVHDIDQQNVYFKEGKEEAIKSKNFVTTLTAYFELNME